MSTLTLSVSLLSACGGDDGDRGSSGEQGAMGTQGEQGVQSLVVQTAVSAGNTQCMQGGVRIDSGVDTDADAILGAGEITDTSYVCQNTRLNDEKNFNRIASFPVCSQIDANCNTDTETAAEIVAVSTDGMTLIYSDSPGEQVGFVDISDPANPLASGVLALSGEPTSVAVKGAYVLVGVNTSTDFVNVAGHLEVVTIATQTSARMIDVGGQPDSVAVSPDGNYVAVVIENERDEDLGDGAPPQLPAGNLVIVNTSASDPANWTTSTVDLSGFTGLYATDPEPEYVDINGNNIAVITLQENNHIFLVDLTDGSIVNDFSAGSVDLTMIDTLEEGAVIDQSDSLSAVLREPDGVAWLNDTYFATADEGDLDGGSRGFTVFDMSGNVIWSAGNTLDHLTARLGHYPDARSENKGNEPENIEVGTFGSERYLFVNSERSSLVFVYDIADPKTPVYKQTLPAAAGPEGGLAIPSRNLLVVASEEDSRGDKLRSSINIYRYGYADASYPTLQSADRENGTPIPWGAMSGLAADTQDGDVLYAVEDSFYLMNRIFEIRVGDNNQRATLTREMRITDADGVLAALPVVDVDDALNEDDSARIDVFDDVDLSQMINSDNTVNIDPEGIAMAGDGGFWIVSEGSGTVGDDDRPINSLNLLLKTDAAGVIEESVTLPSVLNDVQLRFGFEGVAEWGSDVAVAFQRAWGGEANPRIGVYDTFDEEWRFYFYPLDAVASQNGGWVGLSDISHIGGGQFLVLERDNQGGPDAAIKRLYRVDLSAASAGDTLTKTLVRDVVGDLAASGGLVPEKIEGATIALNGDVFIINDNDGVDDNSGETQLLNLGRILED